jgi:hypothetical protein
LGVIALLPSIAGFPAILLVISPSICCADTGCSGLLPVDDELADDEWATLSVSITILLPLMRGVLCPRKTKNHYR